VTLRQSYVRLGKRALFQQSRSAAAQQGKVVVVTARASNWIVGIDGVHGNSDDRATLSQALVQTQQLTTVKPQPAVLDKGFRGKVHHLEQVEVLIAGTRQRTSSLKHLLKRRSTNFRDD
jgi:IS5 family transposase